MLGFRVSRAGVAVFSASELGLTSETQRCSAFDYERVDDAVKYWEKISFPQYVRARPLRLEPVPDRSLTFGSAQTHTRTRRVARKSAVVWGS